MTLVKLVAAVRLAEDECLKVVDVSDNDPSFVSRQYHRYFLFITDEATKYSWVDFLGRKADYLQSYALGTAHIVNLRFRSVAIVGSDVDSVFRGAAMQQRFLDNGIILEHIAIDSPWHDGVSKRGISYIMSQARSVLISSDLPKKFCSEVVLPIVWITNHTPTTAELFSHASWPVVRGHNLCPYAIPFSALTGSRPVLKHLLPLGLTGLVHLHGTAKARDELSPRGL